MRTQKRPRFKRRSLLISPLKPWMLATGLLVSFTATAGVRTTVDMDLPGLRFGNDANSISLAWPTLTAPDIAINREDFRTPEMARAPDAPNSAPSGTQVLQLPEPDIEGEPHLQPGFWRAAQPSDGKETISEAAPDVSVLFRLSTDMMPLANPFSADDGGPVMGAFSGLIAPKAEDRIVLAKAAPASLAPDGFKGQGGMRSPLLGIVKSEREMQCLAEAVYFEARSEPERGQAGVAQVVLNRTQSGAYPTTVCGVVYQNRHRYLACQFTFACEGKSLRITEPGPWRTASRIARDVAEGRTYLSGVGNATHYHANYVRPWWARYMDKREKVGSHIFYFENQ
jgi:hypothetical protein